MMKALPFKLILFALASSIIVSFHLAIFLMFMAGFSTSLYMISVMSTLQTSVPDELRGRVMGIYGMTWSLLPLGAMSAGAIAEYSSAPVAVGIGGAAVAIFALGIGVGSKQVRDLSQ